MNENNFIELYTDGACRGNPGIGAYAYYIIIKNNEEIVLETSGSCAYDNTTNNRMELLGVINGLLKLKEINKDINTINVYTDSQYVVNAFNQHWIDSWIKNDFRRNKKDEVKNIDLWEELLTLLKNYKYTFIWVKGHAGHKYNEICDKLCNIEMDKLLNE